MKIKKFLEKVAEDDRESLINDGDVEFLASIGVDYNKKREADKRQPEASYYLQAGALNQKTVISVFACLAVAVLAVVLILFYTIKPAPFEPPIEYFADNFVEVQSDLTELNEDLQLFSIIVDDSKYKCEVKKTYDSLSEDTLYYTLEFAAKQGIKNFKLDIVVNSHYEHDELVYTVELKEVQISGYTLKYSEDSLSMSVGPFSTVTCKGEMWVGEQWIYITKYDEMAIGQGTFVETIQSIISFK